jgi:hypothetical protein
MTQDLMNISQFKGMVPAGAFAALDPHAESLADGIGSSYGIVGYKGKVWSLRLRGETYMVTRPDDGSPAAFLDVIILRSPPYKSKSFYPANSYQDGQIGVRPICAALNGETPDADILAPQATACAVCPRNVFKLNAEGRKTRECSDYKRLAVMLLPSVSRALLGAALMEPVFLRVPAASLNDLALLGEGMASQGFHYSSYVTRIGFNPEKPHPQMTFRALQGLTDAEAPTVLGLRAEPTAIRITGEEEAKRNPAPAQVTAPVAPVQVAPVAPVQVAPVAPVQQVAPAAAPVKQAEPVAQAPIDTGFGDPAAAPAKVTAAVKPVETALPAGGVVDTGFGTAETPRSIPASAAPATNSVADTGPAEDSDLDLDARVAALLPQ